MLINVFFFVGNKKLLLECRARNDRSAFNKMLMDRILKWRGIQITKELPQLSSSNSLELPFCLSLKPFPTEVIRSEN